ncbi:MAG: antirestriction protein ArdA [Akkermansiaceae bacterium]
MTITPRIYVACLASYNAEILYGEWIDLDGSEDIGERIAEILKKSTIEDAEEWAVHDYEYCGGLLSEHMGMTQLKSLQEAFTQAANEDIEWELFCGFCDHVGYDIETDTIEKFKDSYSRSASSLVDWCQDFLNDTGQLESIPENLRFYFNFEAFARDMEINDVFTVDHDGETHVFYNI